MADMPNKRTIRAIKRRIEVEAAKVSAARDRIQELLNEMDGYDEAWSDAADNLTYAAERLSELL